MTVPLESDALSRRIGRSLLVRGSIGSFGGRIGIGLLALVLLAAFVGPLISPSSPSEIVGLPFQYPGHGHLLGTDVLGRDALSRYLNGGRSLILVSFLSATLASLLGLSAGMAAGYRRGALDLATVGVVDLAIAFPPLVFVLLLLAAAGSGTAVIVIAITVTHAPRIVRIVRSVTMEVSQLEFVEAAVARGERVHTILRRDILPNIWTPFLADFGVRFTGSVLLFSSLSYLGLGTKPPAADWGLMISENRAGLVLQPWVLIVPAATIAVLAIAVNLIADSIARSVGRSVVSRGV